MINTKKYGILLLQVSIVLMAFLVAPALANEPPVVLEGNLLIDGQPAPAGTMITVVAEEKTIAESTVINEGLFGDERSNGLGIKTGYDVVTIYVNGVEAQTLDLAGYQNGEIVSVDLAASSPATSPETKTTTTSGGGGGGFSSSGAVDEKETETASSAEEVIEEPEIKEVLLQSTPDVEEGESLPVSTSQGSNAIVLLGIVLVVSVIGIYLYRTKK